MEETSLCKNILFFRLKVCPIFTNIMIWIMITIDLVSVLHSRLQFLHNQMNTKVSLFEINE